MSTFKNFKSSRLQNDYVFLKKTTMALTLALECSNLELVQDIVILNIFKMLKLQDIVILNIFKMLKLELVQDIVLVNICLN